METMRERLKSWIKTSIEVMYLIRGIVPHKGMDATIVAPEDIVDYLRMNKVLEKYGRSDVFRYSGGTWEILLLVKGEKSNKSQLTIKIVK